LLESKRIFCNPVTAKLHMGTIVNLRMVRKRAKRRQAEQEAGQNRLAHGRSKAEKARERSDLRKAERNLDQHQIEGKDRR
jgi:hypothetical protein